MNTIIVGVQKPFLRILFSILLISFLSACGGTPPLSPIGDHTTHGTVVFDGFQSKVTDIWQVYNTSNSSFVPVETGGGHVRVDGKMKNAQFGSLITKSDELREAYFTVAHMPSGTYALALQLSTRTDGFVITSWGGYPTSTTYAHYFDRKTPLITVRPGEILYVGRVKKSPFLNNSGNSASIEKDKRRFLQFSDIVRPIVDQSKITNATVRYINFDLKEFENR